MIGVQSERSSKIVGLQNQKSPERIKIWKTPFTGPEGQQVGRNACTFPVFSMPEHTAMEETIILDATVYMRL